MLQPLELNKGTILKNKVAAISARKQIISVKQTAATATMWTTITKR